MLGRPCILIFHKTPKKDNIPNLKINGLTVEHESSLKFPGVLINENLSWRDHMDNVKNEIAKKKKVGLFLSGEALPRWALPQTNLLCLHTYLLKLCKNNID